MPKFWIFLFLNVGCLQLSHAAKILFILPVPTYSHYVVGEVLSKALASRGHHVTVVGPFPPKADIKNYRYISLEGIHQVLRDILDNVNFFDYDSAPLITKAMLPNEMGYAVTKFTLAKKQVQNLLYFPGEFDAVIFELFNTEAFYGVCHHFKAACIPLAASGTNIWTNRLTGNVGLASYVADMITDLPPEMSFFERVYNLASIGLQEVLFHLHALPNSNELIQDVLPRTPHLKELIYNTSLVLLNSHPALGVPLPLTPNMKEIGGVHIEALRNDTIPNDVQEFLDKHEEGVIYFALGSNLKSKDLPPERLRTILEALKRWGKPVLWKFEGELPEKMDHVKVAKWFPQTAVLAHKNINAFVTHCGRLSTMEALYYGVPMVAISIAAEQGHNAAEMVHLGYALWLKFKTFTSDDFYNALVEITENPRYAKEANTRSRAMKKHKATDEAIYWIEHAIEFEGAAYLRNVGIKLPWYQFWMVDVITFLILTTVAVSIPVVYLILSCVENSKKKEKTKIH